MQSHALWRPYAALGNYQIAETNGVWAGCLRPRV